jgi:L-2-hydroxyglutarate oxidase LhgO
VPGARSKDWVLERAGQRVQVIKKGWKKAVY